MTVSDTGLVADIRQALADAGDAERAVAMRRYLKSELPCRGISLPGVRQIVRTVDSARRISERDVWETAVRTLWDDAAYREERYAATALTGQKAYQNWQDPAAIDLYRHMIVVGAWWDLVDEIAIRRVGPILRAYPIEVRSILLVWAVSEDMWLRRTSIIAQIGAKDATDTDLLTACIEPNMASAEFFLRKGIGWALREYAKADPAWVRSFVEIHEAELSPLSVREATKHIARRAG